ncbi:hypothetical protein [Rhodopirellula baltica]
MFNDIKTPADFDAALFASTQDALREANVNATQLLERDPDASLNEIARQIGNRCTARGLVMHIYRDALANDCLRDAAIDLLYRKILQEFPSGWTTEGTIRPTVKIGSWYSHLIQFAPFAGVSEIAEAIVRDMAFSDPPPPDWLPANCNDTYIQKLFQRNWPADQKTG